jgi:hypothetical protein
MKHTIKTNSNEYVMSCTNALTFPLFHLSTLMKNLNYKKVMYREYSIVIANYNLKWLKINFEMKFPGRFPL